MSNTSKPPSMIVRLPESIYKILSLKKSSFTTFLGYSQSESTISLSFPTYLSESFESLTFSSIIQPVDEDLYIFLVDEENEPEVLSQIKYRGILIPSNPIYQEEPVVSRFYSIQTTPQNKPEKIQPRILHLHPNHKAYISSNPEKVLRDCQNNTTKRRVRGEREKIKEYLFTLFAKERYWRIKALGIETEQPDAFISEIMKEIGERIPNGPYKSFWELKELYISDQDPLESFFKRPKLE